MTILCDHGQDRNTCVYCHYEDTVDRPMTDLITKLDDERLDSSGPYPSREVMYDSLCSALQVRDVLKEWKDGANVMITALNNRIREIENQFTGYALESEIKRDALLKRVEEAEKLAALHLESADSMKAAWHAACEDISKLQARMEEAEGKVCRMREVLKNCRYIIHDLLCAGNQDENLQPAGCFGACKQATSALSSTGPCRHEEEAKQLGNLLALMHRDGGHHQSEVGTEQAIKDAEVIYYDLRGCEEEAKRLMEVILWAGESAKDFFYYTNDFNDNYPAFDRGFEEELRRRAEKGGE